jgi:hypothetical protein
MNSTDQMNQCLTAIDFRAGLALLPFLPMSPGDFRLIFQGVFHGSMVQFDRGDIRKLQTFIDNNAQGFQGFETLVEELKISERDYRSSLPDIAHHHIHLITNKELRKKIRHEFISAWNKKGYADEKFMSRLNSSHLVFFFFYGLGIIPLFGKLLRRYSGCLNYRKHINHCFTSWSYFLKTMRVIRAELLLSWCMEGRGSPDKLFSLVDRPINFLFQRIFLSWLPGALHRLLTDWSYTKAKIIYTVQYPIKFYREADFREQWFRQQLKEGYEQGMLTREEYDKISSKIKEPFIQKYLKCVAVHLCTLPVTTVVSISIALYTMLFLSKNMQEGLIYAAAILAFFQGTPISPGSITRGSYVFYLMIKERDIKNYWVAAIVSIWHYVGFLGFPMQMVTKYPALARFLAGKWATNIVGFVPVFGEKGALFEHKMFDLFFNVPLTIKRKFSRKK